MPVPTFLTITCVLFVVLLPQSDGHGSIGYYYSGGYRQCNTGRYNRVRPNGNGAFICPGCPSGWYQDQIGQGQCKQCSGGRTSSPVSAGPCSNPCGQGSYSSSGSCQNCLAGQYQDQTSQSSCKTCTQGNYCPSGSITPTSCPAGVVGSGSGLSTPGCSNPCPAAQYCPTGSTSGVLCPAGKYGATSGLTSPSCSGQCPAGYLCPTGTAGTTTMSSCGPVGVYCATGSATIADRLTPTSGYYASPANNNGASELLCPKGYYCVAGLKTLCPKGTYGSTTGLASSSCTGQCREGYHCPTGSISGTQEPCAPDGNSQPQNYFCPAGTGRTLVSNGKITGPTSASANHREFETACPVNNVCTNGVATPILSWTGAFDVCNSNAASPNLFGWNAQNVAEGTIPEATVPASARLLLTAALSSTLSGSITYGFVKCPTCCTGQQCVADCQNPNVPGSPFELSSLIYLQPTSQSILNAEACTSPYYYQIKATTTAGAGSTIYCQVKINVGDVNEKPIITAAQVRTVVEESVKGTEVGSPIVAVDPEVAAGQQGLTWSIHTCVPKANGVCPFRIRSCQGQLVVFDAAQLDYEVNTQFTLLIVATDDGDSPLSSDATTVLVNIVNTNDPPTIVAQNFNVNENVDTAEASCTYSNDPCVCLLRCPSGKERFGDGSACRETSDPSNTALKCDLGHCHGVPNSLLSTPMGPCVQGTAVATVVGEDPDDGDVVSFSYTAESSCPFQIDPNSGEMFAIGVVNFESRRDWTLKVTLSDSSGLLSDTVDVVVTVLNGNDLPKFEGTNIFTIREDCTVSSTGADCTHQLSGTDDDDLVASGSTSFGSPLTYALNGGNSCGLDVTSAGLIKPSSSANFDFETTSTCTLGIEITDAGNGQTTKMLTVNILDVNENPSLGTSPTCSVLENVTALTRLPAPCILVGTDPDTVYNQVLTFSASASADLSLDNNRVLVLQSLDFETTKSYTINININDDGPSGNQLGTIGSASGTQVVTVIDVNEPPTLDQNLYFSVAENTAASTVFYIDPNSNTWTITIQSQSLTIDAGMTVTQGVGLELAEGTVGTSVDGTTVTISILAPIGFVFGTTKDLTIDAGNTNVVVAFGTIDDAAVVLTPSTNAGLSAVDPENSPLTFSLHLFGGTSSGTFDSKNNAYDYFDVAVGTNNMQVVGNNLPDYEAIPGSDATLEVHIKVTDDGGTRNAGNGAIPGTPNLFDENGVITVVIKDVNEPPTLVAQPNGIKVGSSTLNDSVVTILDYRDPDFNNTIIYSEVGTTGWQNSNGDVLYSLDSSSGEITLKHDASGSGSTSVTVTAKVTDQDEMASDDVSYTIDIIQDNTAPSMPTQSVQVSENAAINSTIATLSAFVIDPEVTNVCDPSTVVRASDSSRLCTAVQQSSDGTTWQRVCLQDSACALTEEETSCTCRQQSLIFVLEKTFPLASELDDQQSDLIDYPFELTESGQIQVISQLDFETLALYTLTVKIEDTGTATNYPGLSNDVFDPGTFVNQLSTVATVTITITNALEAPFFDYTSKTLTVAEDVSVGFVIQSKIVATDQDLTEWFNSKLRFKKKPHATGTDGHTHPNGIDPAKFFDFIDGPNSFEGGSYWDANAETHFSKLKVTQALDFETSASYTLEVSSCHDCFRVIFRVALTFSLQQL